MQDFFFFIQIFKVGYLFLTEKSETTQRWKAQTRETRDPVLTLHCNTDFNGMVEV